MKRALSYILSVVLFVTSLSTGLVSVGQTIPHQSKLEKFAVCLTDMIRKHDCEVVDVPAESTLLDEITEYFPITYAEHYMSVFESNMSVDNSIADNHKTAKDFGLPENAFDLNRLIVKSENEIDYCGAIDCVNGYRNLHILQYDSVEATISAYEYYLSLDTIDYVEPDLIYETQGEISGNIIASDDIDVETEDYIEIIDRDIPWNSIEIGFQSIKDKFESIDLNEVIVAVIDSGADTDHELLKDRLIESNVNLTTTGSPNSCEDDFGHGTHVSGTIVDNTPESVKIKPYKVLNKFGKGSISTIAIAVDMAVEDGVDIINLSLVGEGESQTMTLSVNNAVENNVNVICAAGNNKVDLSKTYYSPACIESAITVSAVTKDHKLASFSNYNGPIDIAAPGEDIVSSYLNNTYVSMKGTSMAAPQVVAGLAILRSLNVEKTNFEVEEILEEYAIHLNEAEGENKFGAGILYLKHILEDKPRTVEPTFSVQSCEFVNSFNLAISCYEKDSKILYVVIEKELNGNVDVEDLDIDFLKADLYEGVIHITVDTIVAAVSFSDDKKFSPIVIMQYDRKNTCEADFYDVDSSGMITGYVGNEENLIIPDIIQGKRIKGIASSAFEDNDNIRSVVLPSTVTHIGVEAFKNCKNLESVTGGSVTHINLNAFENSGISEFPFEKVKSISDKAFYGCKNLKNVDLPNAEKIGVSAFENAGGIAEISNTKLTTLGNYAFRGTDLVKVNLPKVTTIGNGAFEKCYNLTSVSIPLLKEVPANAFKNCSSLSEVVMPDITSIGNYAFQEAIFEAVKFEKVISVGSYAFRDADLKYVFLPNVTEIAASCFYNCQNLKFIYLPVLKELNANAFAKCDMLKSVFLPAVETVKKNAFKNSSIEYLQLDNVATIESLPDKLLGAVLPSTLTSVTATIPETEFKVYGYENSYAHQFAEDNSKEFLPVPAMICETPDNVSIDEQYIYTYALGFNCTYQWYKNDTVSNENGTLLEGANHYWYEPTKADNAVSYYCVITSDDGVNHSEFVTEPIANIPEYRCADYTAYESVVEKANKIDRELYTDESLSALDILLSLDISDLSLAEQSVIDECVAKIKEAIASLTFNYVLGDVNDDGKISLLDARLTLKAVSGTEELDSTQTLSADMNEDGKISLIDVRAILRIVSEVTETE